MAERTRNKPDLLFLVFFGISFLFCLSRKPFHFRVFFSFFSKDSRGSEDTESPCLFSGFPRVFSNKKKQGKELPPQNTAFEADSMRRRLRLQFAEIGRREKTPTPKTRFSIWTLLRTPGRFTTRPLPVYFTTKMSVVKPFSVLSKDEPRGPKDQKNSRFRSGLKISIENEIFERATHCGPIFCGKIETSRLKFSSAIKNFD